jgi:error-prone DNA polymerase
MACTFSTFQARSALRDVARALDLPPALLGQAEKAIDREEGEGRSAENRRTTASPHSSLGPAPSALAGELCRQIDGLPRHLGQHSGGMVITRTPVVERVPIEPARMPRRVVVQWDKDALETAGMIKIDILGLRMLSAISGVVGLIGQTSGKPPDLDRLTFDDPQVYAMIVRADTIGVFQVESRAQAQILPRLKPRCLNDLIVAISLIHTTA